MTADQEAAFRAFLERYKRVREAEGWGGDDLDLPFRARRHREIWNIRKRTFRKVARIIGPATLHSDALDVAAGNGWLSRHLVRWGFRVTALDVNMDTRDGLRAGRHYIEQGDRFSRVRAPGEALPFEAASFDLVIVSGGFHYMDGVRALAEFGRVLKPGGRAIVCDSPWYESAVDGDRGVRERSEEHDRLYGARAEEMRESTYLLAGEFDQTAREAGFTVSTVFPWTGARRAWNTLKARTRGQALARFPIIVLGVENGN